MMIFMREPSMIKNSLTFKLTALVLLFSSLITGAVIANNYFFSRALIIEQAEANSHTRGREIANQLSALIKPIEQASRNIGLALEDSLFTRQQIGVLSQHIVEGNDKLFGLSIAFEPYELSHDQLFYAPYSYRLEDKIICTQLGSRNYRYFTWTGINSHGNLVMPSGRNPILTKADLKRLLQPIPSLFTESKMGESILPVWFALIFHCTGFRK